MSEKLSRSEIKRQFKQIEGAAKELADLGDADLSKLSCSEMVKEEILLCRSTKGGARKRQVKYIAKLLQREDLDEILQFLKDRRGSKIKENRFHHEIERLRDGIINEALETYDECRKNHEEWEMDWESESIAHVVQLYPFIDELDIRRCAYNYARSRNRTHYRELFRLLKAASEKQKMNEF